MVVRTRSRLFVEGGGNSDALKTECRRGFRMFLERAGLRGRLPRIVACGSRTRAYETFRVAIEGASDTDTLVLLVDSEGPVPQPATSAEPWHHVGQHIEDQWEKPAGACDSDLHFMVQCMESWLLADRSVLRGYFGPRLNERALPQRSNVERIDKSDVLRGLRNATRDTPAGPYSKSKHAFKLLAQIDPARVREASAYAERFLTHLHEVLQ